MAFLTRDGKFDVAVVAAPNVSVWPSAGVRMLSAFCAEMDLSVGLFGGDALKVRGVVPLPGTGGLILIEDAQGRIHRIQARAVVKVSPSSSLPDPFSGWRSAGLIPLSTATRLRKESLVQWSPATMILGTGNRALRFGSDLLESGVSEVYCLETFAQWGAKRFSGWEVDRRRFEINGGKMLEGAPVSLTPKGALLWEFRVKDQRGVRVLDVARVVSAGPFRDLPGIKEYPPGSFLFELDQTAGTEPSEDMDGWAVEEERGRWLAAKIIKALIQDLGPNREKVDQAFRRARTRLKRYFKHREDAFTPTYQGKWISSADSLRLRNFVGVPKRIQQSRPIASVECIEEISCNVCQVACPELAIASGRALDESKCTGCGACVIACPSKVIPLIHEKEDQSVSKLFLPVPTSAGWKVGDFGSLLNRRGEPLGSARIVGSVEEPEHKRQIVELEVPTHLIWEARGLRRPRKPSLEESVASSIYGDFPLEERVDVSLNGERRLVRNGIPISVALFEIGQSRPGDNLLCADGSCGLCEISVDGIKKLACQTDVHRGMAIRFSTSAEPDSLCPCLGVSPEKVVARLTQGELKSPEALLSVTHLGEGRCHGQLCMSAFKRVLMDQGLDVSQWIDWRFPWSDWTLTHN